MGGERVDVEYGWLQQRLEVSHPVNGVVRMPPILCDGLGTGEELWEDAIAVKGEGMGRAVEFSCGVED